MLCHFSHFLRNRIAPSFSMSVILGQSGFDAKKHAKQNVVVIVRKISEFDTSEKKRPRLLPAQK